MDQTIEDENQELIRTILLQDRLQEMEYENPYSEPKYSNPIGESSEDENYNPDNEMKRKSAKRNKKKPSPKKPSPKKLSKKETNPNIVTGKWNEKEHQLFVEGLETFGRDWRKISEYVGTRDRDSIRSHAQKHFMKMHRSGLPLPAKVLESGAGYTVSGAPLSEAAMRKYAKEQNPPSTDVVPAVSNDQAGAGECPNSFVVTEQSDPNADEKLAKKRRKEPPELSSPGSAVPYDVEGRTEYAKTKLRHQTKEHSSFSLQEDSLTMVKCSHFHGPPLESPQSQPFKVEILSNVMLVCDVHAHLATTEIIGFLAGTWHSEEKVIRVVRAFPCKTLVTGQDTIRVEMDPESEIQIREQISKENLRVVGWYHSHPVFQPDPSLTDIHNQSNYQQLFRQDDVEPFVGLIVAPYDVRIPTEQSATNLFYVKKTSGSAGQPMYVEHTIVQDDTIPETISQELNDLLQIYKKFDARVRMDDLWRNYTPNVPVVDNNFEIKPVTKLEKFQKAIRTRLPSSFSAEQADSFMQKLTENFTK